MGPPTRGTVAKGVLMLLAAAVPLGLHAEVSLQAQEPWLTGRFSSIAPRDEPPSGHHGYAVTPPIFHDERMVERASHHSRPLPPDLSQPFIFATTRQPNLDLGVLPSAPPDNTIDYPMLTQQDYGLYGEYQQAPGAVLGYAPYLSAAEAYSRFSEYAYEPGTGPRPYADYAPPGYYYTPDYQSAPGTPLYQPILPPVAIAPDDMGRVVLRGPIPGSYLVPGTSTAFRFSGFVRMGANFDFGEIGTPDLFLPRAITTPERPGQNANYSARPTRFSLDTWTPTAFNDWMLHTFIQFDFLSGNPPAVGSSSNPRLRFAFVDFGYFRVGQDTTVFMDPSAFPRTADFQGPNGIVNSRQGLARVTLPVTERIYWAAAAEQPFTDITTLGEGMNVQDFPDVTTHLRYEADRFHVQVASVMRTLGYRSEDESVTRRAGWGVNVTSSFHPWAILMGTNPLRDEAPGPFSRSRVLTQYAHGRGIGRYIQDSSGTGLDAAINAEGGFETLSAQGWTLAYEQWLSQRWLGTLAYSNARIGSTNALPDDTFSSSQYLAATLWWIPVTNLSLGTEYLWGERENLDGQDARASRIQTVMQYNF